LKSVKKILLVADVALKNPSSGSEQVLCNQAMGLARIGMHVSAITRQNGSFPTVHRNLDRNVKEACYSASPDNVFKFFGSLFKETSKLFKSFSQDELFDAAVCHHPFAYFSLLVSGKLKNIPVIHVFHSPTHQEYLLLNEQKSWLKKAIPSKTRWLIERYCLKKSTKIMVLSHYMKNLIVDTYGVSADRIVINPGGVDLERFKPVSDRSKVKEDLGFPVDHIHLLTVRNLESRMGLDNLIRAIDIIKKNSLKIYLTIVGDGPERENLERLIQEYRLNDDIQLTGFVPSESLPLFYCAADFFILPTRKLEGFGLVTPESMSCGTPVLGTPIGATEEILGNFNRNFLFRDATPNAIARGIQFAVKRYFENETKYNELRCSCRDFIKNNYAWQRHVRQLKSIILSAVADRDALLN
jgi:glycosyltransferase involved in cell wall biosynthesis